MKQMDKDGAKVNFSDRFTLDTFIQNGEHWTNFVDSGSGLSTIIPTSYAIKEFDPSLTAILNFADPEAFKALICPLGVEELRLVLRYELANLNILIVATRTNQILLDSPLRQLAEIELLEKGYSVTAPVFDLYGKLASLNIYETNLKRMTEIERSRTSDFIKANIRPFYFDVMKRKTKSRSSIEKQFTKMRQWVSQQMQLHKRKDEI